VGRGRDACGGQHNTAVTAGVVRGVVPWSMINSEVIIAGVWSEAKPGQGGVGGRSFSFLHLFRGGQVVAKGSRVVLYCSRVVGGEVFLIFTSFVWWSSGGRVVTKW